MYLSNVGLKGFKKVSRTEPTEPYHFNNNNLTSVSPKFVEESAGGSAILFIVKTDST